MENRDSSSDRKPSEAAFSARSISEAPELPRAISLKNTGVIGSDDIVALYYCENGVCESASVFFWESILRCTLQGGQSYERHFRISLPIFLCIVSRKGLKFGEFVLSLLGRVLERSQNQFCVCDTQTLICVCARDSFVCGPRIKFCALAQTWVVTQSLVSEKRSDWLTPW